MPSIAPGNRALNPLQRQQHPASLGRAHDRPARAAWPLVGGLAGLGLVLLGLARQAGADPADLLQAVPVLRIETIIFCRGRIAGSIATRIS